MHYVTKKYTKKTDAVVSIEMLVPMYQPIKLSYAHSPPQAYRKEAGQTKHRNIKQRNGFPHLATFRTFSTG